MPNVQIFKSKTEEEEDDIIIDNEGDKDEEYLGFIILALSKDLTQTDRMMFKILWALHSKCNRNMSLPPLLLFALLRSHVCTFPCLS